jgi:hypothetical protein
MAGYGQCVPQKFCDDCIGKISTAKYNYLKSFKIEEKDKGKQKVEYSYVLTKGTKYMVNICMPENQSKMKVSIYDSKRNLIVTNEAKQKYKPSVKFNCSATGIYYFQYAQEMDASCAGSALGFAKAKKR